MKYKHAFVPNVTPIGRAFSFFRKVVEESGDSLVRALAKEREFICDRSRVLLNPEVPPVEGAR